MPSVYGALDLQRNELRNPVIQNLGSAPSTPAKGQLYFNSTGGDNTLYWYDGTQWVPAKASSTLPLATSVSTLVVGGAGSAGAASDASRGDHVHALPNWGPSSAETTFGTAKGDGVAGTFARSDHTHGNPPLTAVVPQALLIGGTSAVGSGTLPAREDHTHQMPGFGPPTPELTFGIAAANGSSVNVARADHTHGTPSHTPAEHSGIPINSLGVAQAALNLNGQQINNLAAPVLGSDAANKTYVDSIASGIDSKASVKAASTANLTLSGTQTVDGIALVANDRVLVKDQTIATNNGVYLVQAGAWTRPTDLDQYAEFPSAYVWVEQGTANGDSGWVCTVDQGGSLGSTPITWVQFSGAGQITAGAGLTKTGNSLDVVAGDTSLTVAADSVAVNTGVIATVVSVTAKADKTTTLAAGNGLTGGGDLSANRTLDVGAGTGITVAADTVAVDTTVIATRAYADAAVTGLAKKFAAALTGTASPETVPHNLGTRDITLTVLNGSSPYTAVEVDWDATTVNTATIRYSPNLGAGYRVVVTG